MKRSCPVILFLLLCFPAFGQEMFRDIVYDQVNRLTMTYSDTLKTDIYFIPGVQNKKKSPLILLVHGGGFYTGSRDGELETDFAMDMARRGYVVASMDYDLTRKGKKEGFGCQCPSDDKIATFRQAVLNIDQALDYLLKFSKEFNFDPDKLILAGSSAGAEAVLHAAYARDHKAFKGIMDEKRNIAAVVSYAGALLQEVEWGNQYRIPAFMVHGTRDELVPYNTAPHHFCDEEAPGYLVLKGSETLAATLGEQKVPYTLLTAEGGGHEWANKAYSLKDEVSAFMYNVLFKGTAGRVEQTIGSRP